jgi:membrane-associated protease RseP (regulator of RpoE activity)
MYWNGGDLQGMKELRGAMRMLGRGRLGVQVQDLNGDDDAPGGRGVRVEDVTDDTPASRAGFRSGDVIVRVGDRDVADTQELRDALAGRPAGRVDVVVRRHGERITLTPVLEEPGRMMMGRGWKQTSPGEWRFDSPNGEKHMIMRRGGGEDDDEDDAPQVKIKRWSSNDDGDDDGGMGSGRSHRIVIRGGDGGDVPMIRARDARDRAEMERQIAELKRQIKELKRQLEEERR